MAHVLALVVPLLVACSVAAAAELPVKTVKQDAAVSLVQGKKVFATYRLEPQKETALSVESGCYFHPLKTPAGVTVTEVGPPDHPHHRGVFLAWVEMRGKTDADFWGWGEHAPKHERRIVHREVTEILDSDNTGGFIARNDWMAGDEVVLEEELRANAATLRGVNVLDLKYTLTPKFDITLARWAFGGFCVRTRGDGKLEAFGPDGRVERADPGHLKPETDWPAAMWYAYQLRGVAGGGDETVGVAVVDHPKNPPTLWHNHRGNRMLNPCITAPAAVRLPAGRPLELRYRVMAFDGELPRRAIQLLAEEFRKNYPPR
jgi:hypothetical protein